jgi:cytochrome c556
MKLTAKAILVGCTLFAGLAYAADATDPTVKAWQELMDTQGGSMKVLGGMAGGEVPFDAAAAEAAKAALVASSADIAAKFGTQATDPASKAKPEIWTSWDDFLGDAKELNEAATALDATTLDGVKAGLGAVGAVCKDCHSEYKAS